MAPAKSHYAIYKPFDKGIVIAKVLHGRQNIEMIVNKMGFKLALEIEEMESRHKNE